MYPTPEQLRNHYDSKYKNGTKLSQQETAEAMLECSLSSVYLLTHILDELRALNARSNCDVAMGFIPDGPTVDKMKQITGVEPRIVRAYI